MLPLVAALLSAAVVSYRDRRHIVLLIPLVASIAYLALPIEGRFALVAIVAISTSTALAYALAWGARLHAVFVLAGGAAVGLLVALSPLSRIEWIAASWGPLFVSVIVGTALLATRRIERTITSATLAGMLALDTSACIFIPRSAGVVPSLAALEAGMIAALQIGWLLSARREKPLGS